MRCTRQTRTEGLALGRCEGRVQTVLPPTVLAPLLTVAAVLKPRNTQVVETFEPNPCRARWPSNQRHQQHQQHNTPSSRSDHIIFHSCVRCCKLDLALTGVHRVNVDSLTSFTFSSPFWLSPVIECQTIPQRSVWDNWYHTVYGTEHLTANGCSTEFLTGRQGYYFCQTFRDFPNLISVTLTHIQTALKRRWGGKLYIDSNNSTWKLSKQVCVCVIWRGYGNLPVDPTQCRQTTDVGRDLWQAKDGLTVTSWLMVPNLNNNTFHGLRSLSHASTQLWCHHHWCVRVLACNEYMSQGDKEQAGDDEWFLHQTEWQWLGYCNKPK